jgi:hypothetical protein
MSVVIVGSSTEDPQLLHYPWDMILRWGVLYCKNNLAAPLPILFN